MRFLRFIWPTFFPAPWDIWNWATLYGPALLAGLALLAGVVQELPLMWVIVGGALAFGGAATGAVKFTEWRQMQRVQDKLGFSKVRFVKDIRGRGMGLGFLLANKATFPIEFEVISIRTKIGDQVPKYEEFKIKNFTVPPEGGAWFDDHIIELKDIPKPGVLDGQIEFEVRYGRPGRLRYTLSDKKAAQLSFDEHGAFKIGSWNNAV